ncbi:28S ribosomal protein S23, mitochondrial [Geospiza fortis]|uniref:28S ribosomal protein S23, mitochondrial n=1 Tax=Geospiza fortis TaxID=48883 RepID=A0A8N5EUT9_GEOFO|nr:28S ribosomal protein S23, mitochondrial [Geospiza fortis]
MPCCSHALRQSRFTAAFATAVLYVTFYNSRALRQVYDSRALRQLLRQSRFTSPFATDAIYVSFATATLYAVLYREDTVRARFYKVYGNGPKPFDLTQLNFKSTCQRFVEKYNELKEEGKIEEEKLFEETGKALLASGILLQRRGVDKGAAARDAASQPQLQDKRKDGQEQPPELAGTQKENPCPS